MRGRMSAARSYAAPGRGRRRDGRRHRLRGRGVPRRRPRRSATMVLSYSGWQTHAVVRRERRTPARPVAPAPVSTALGVLGMPGFTAYAGLLEIGRPKPGETVVVAAATGPVGSAVGQIARIKGARAVGIAGGPEKCAALHRGVRLRRRARPPLADLRRGPEGSRARRHRRLLRERRRRGRSTRCCRRLNKYARVPVCGLVANYNATSAPEGPDRLPGFMGQVLTQSLTVRGFIQDEFTKLPRPRLRARHDAAGWPTGRCATARTSSRGWRTPPRRSGAAARARTSASCSSRSARTRRR